MESSPHGGRRQALEALDLSMKQLQCAVEGWVATLCRPPYISFYILHAFHFMSPSC